VGRDHRLDAGIERATARPVEVVAQGGGMNSGKDRTRHFKNPVKS